MARKMESDRILVLDVQGKARIQGQGGRRDASMLAIIAQNRTRPIAPENRITCPVRRGEGSLLEIKSHAAPKGSKDKKVGMAALMRRARQFIAATRNIPLERYETRTRFFSRTRSPEILSAAIKDKRPTIRSTQSLVENPIAASAAKNLEKTLFFTGRKNMAEESPANGNPAI
jgi:hypothetical protein